MKNLLLKTLALSLLLFIPVLFNGCAELNAMLDDFNKNMSTETKKIKTTGPPTKTANEKNPVRVKVDTQNDWRATVNDPFWKVRNPVSVAPKIVYTMDKGQLGEFKSCFIQISQLDSDGKPISGTTKSVNDVQAGYTILLPATPFTLTAPGEGAYVDPTLKLESGNSYLLQLVVSGLKSAHTHSVIITIQ